MLRERNSFSDEELYAAVASGAKKYVRYEEGAKLYLIGRNSFIELAFDADAVFKYHGCALVNIKKTMSILKRIGTKKNGSV